MPPLSVRKLMLGIITKMASIDLSSRNSFIALSGRSEVAQLSTRQPEHSRGSAEECVVVWNVGSEYKVCTVMNEVASMLWGSTEKYIAFIELPKFQCRCDNVWAT
jgi:hypothetical protein